MKQIIIMFILATASVFAEARVFEKTQNVTRTEFPCLWRTAQCDLNDMEEDLIADCYNAGFDTCTVLSSRVVPVSFNPHGICGATNKARCEVKVRGRN